MRTHIVVPEKMIEEIDSFVGPRKRSEFFTAAAEEQLRRLRLVRAINKVAGSLKDVDIPGWETPESTVEWVMRQREDWDRERLDAFEWTRDDE